MLTNDIVNIEEPAPDIKKFLTWQGSRGRRIRRPGTKKIGFGRMVLLRDDSTDARFFAVMRPKTLGILHRL